MDSQITEEVVHELAGLVLDVAGIYQFNVLGAIADSNKLVGCEEIRNRLEKGKLLNEQLGMVAKDRITKIANLTGCQAEVFYEISSMVDRARNGRLYESEFVNHLEDSKPGRNA